MKFIEPSEEKKSRICRRIFAEAAAQPHEPRRFFKISVLFFQPGAQPFYNFPGGSICLSNRQVFFQESQGLYIIFFNRHKFSRRQFIKQTYVFSRLFIEEQTLLSHRTDTNFPRNPYLPVLVIEHMQIFQEPLFSLRTDIQFPGSLI